MGKAANLASLGDLTFQTSTASVSAANNTATTLFTLASNTFATYIVTAGVPANDPANYHEVAIISQQGTTLQMTTLVNAALLSISVSGLDIKATQSSGLTQTVRAHLTCLNKA